MKKTNQLQSLKTPVDHVWQAELTQNDWQRITKEAKLRKSSYSWIVRYCVFRLINQITSLPITKLDTANQSCKIALQATEEPLHRFQMCLYGDDTFLLQTVAMKCGLSVSMLIRISIFLYLQKLESGCVSNTVFYWYGIKFVKKALAQIGALRVRPYSWHWMWQNFSAETYYNMPKPTLGCLYLTYVGSPGNLQV